MIRVVYHHIHPISSLSSPLSLVCPRVAVTLRRSYCTSSPVKQKFSTTEERKEAHQYAKAKTSCKAVGIVGLPNVGKSTLFNALTSTQLAEAANYPFCTIEPNIGKVAVPDDRLTILAGLGKSAKITNTQLEFVDIAGLVKGASDGQGLGNRFLANIRQVSLIVHLVRCFEGSDIAHVESTIDPVRDIETINTELLLADLQSMERIFHDTQKKGYDKTKDLQTKKEVVERTYQVLEAGRPAREVMLSDREWPFFKELHLLTAKPVLQVCNVLEADANTGNKYTEQVNKYTPPSEHRPIVVSARIEEELANMENEEAKKEFLAMYGLDSNGLKKIITASREMLGLHCFYTVGPTEARAWTISIGTKAKQAAGEIHSDFEKSFIKADTISYGDFVKYKGNEASLRSEGKLRAEGASYVVKDGDIMLFRHSAQIS